MQIAPEHRIVSLVLVLMFFCSTGTSIPIYAYMISLVSLSRIPVDRFIGKSPEYVFFYQDESRRKAQRRQSNLACVGYVISVYLISVYMVRSNQGEFRNIEVR